MCNNSNSLVPFGLKMPTGAPSGPLVPHAAVPFVPPGFSLPDIQRAQLYDYNARLRLHYAVAAAGLHPGLHPGPSSHPPSDPMAAYVYGKHFAADPRLRYLHEEPKPSHSYIGLIAMAILSSKDKKLVLSDIYQWILDHYPYFRTRGPGWRNSIRHNLSLNDCFVKSGRSANGKGHFWAIHPANHDDFSKGDFRRRRAQRKVRKAMGLAVPDEEDSPSPPPAPMLAGTTLEWQNRMLMQRSAEDPPTAAERPTLSPPPPKSPTQQPPPPKKRQFDVESLLAPDKDESTRSAAQPLRPPILNPAMPRLPAAHQALWPFACGPWEHRRSASAFHPLSSAWSTLQPQGFGPRSVSPTENKDTREEGEEVQDEPPIKVREEQDDMATGLGRSVVEEEESS